MKIPLAQPDIGKDEIQSVMETMKSGWVTQGKKVKDFEESFATYCGVKYGVAVSSGTATLYIALAALGIKAFGPLLNATAKPKSFSSFLRAFPRIR